MSKLSESASADRSASMASPEAVERAIDEITSAYEAYREGRVSPDQLDRQLSSAKLKAEAASKAKACLKGGDQGQHPGSVFDDELGLTFFPTARSSDRWIRYVEKLPRPSRAYRHDHIGYITEQFRPYLEKGALYSGHLLRVDRPLYLSIIAAVRRSAEFDSADEYFRAQGILTPIDLSYPEAMLSPGARAVIRANVRLVGERVALGHIATHAKREFGRRLQSVVAQLESARPT